MIHIKRIDELNESFQNEIKIDLTLVSVNENKKIAKYTEFFTKAPSRSKKIFNSVASKLYGGFYAGTQPELGLMKYNGNRPYESCAEYMDKTLYTIVNFGKKESVLSDSALSLLGRGSKVFPYYYAIMVENSVERQLYLASFSDDSIPNWNHKYTIVHCVKLDDVKFPILNEVVEYKMDANLLSELMSRSISSEPMFGSTRNGVWLMIDDGNGHYHKLEGDTYEDVFRDYADNYTGYRNFRRPDTPEWNISSEEKREEYQKWVKTAKGLKSDFDKFYGGGIVD